MGGVTDGATTKRAAETAEAIRAYAALTREALGTSEAGVISYAGLWLLLASLAPALETDDAGLGLARPDARAAALRLLEAPHPTVGAAVAGWLRPDVTVTPALPVPLDPLPGQAELDRWAAEGTRGLIERFPAQVSPDTLLLLASALVITPRWTTPLAREGGLLVLDAGLQAVVETSAAGLVAVARPDTADQVDVLSVVAAPDVPAAEVWRAVDEVLARLPELTHGSRPADLEDGHAWSVRDVVETFYGRPPDEGAELWRSHLPEWRADATHDLRRAPGVGAVASAIAARVPQERPVWDCVQAATARYDDKGFYAAAVTAMHMMAATAAMPQERHLRRIDLTFDRPHAVVAVARGGAWDGVPLFHCWVRP